MSQHLNLLVRCVILTQLWCYACGSKTIGAIFDEGNLLMQAAFTVAIENANKDHEEDPFEPVVIETAPGELVEAEEAMCSLLEKNILGLLGPTKPDTVEHIQSMADFLEIPQILMHPVNAQNRNWTAVNLYPSFMSYSQVFTDLIEMKGWEELTIIYEGAELLPFLDNVFNMQDIETGDRIVMNIVQLPDGDDFRTQLQTVKSSGSVNYLVDCSFANLENFLQQAQQVGIMSDQHSYIIMDPDFHLIDIEPYKHGGSNITGIRFFDLESEEIQLFISAINDTMYTLNEGEEHKENQEVPEIRLRFSLALIHDAVMLHTAAITSLGLEEGPVVNCSTDESWFYGTILVNHLRTMEMNGLTGKVEFDDEGTRSDFDIDIFEVMGHGYEKVAIWSLDNGLEESRTVIPPAETEGSELMRGKHFIIITALSAPYGMLKESSNKLEGNDRYEGFGIELIDELAKLNGFNYTFEIQADGVYGSLDKTTGKWTGMMEKIMDGRVDFGITDLTITAARQKAVDFTSPFMNLGITILYKKPTKQPPDLFSFISPFSYEVWGWVAGAYCGVSVLIFVLGRLAPEEWQNPYPCIEEPETLDNQFTLANSFWFTLGSVLTQGSEIAPIAVSTRMAGSMWWFFTLIMVSSYTANLAAFLTVESKFYAIKNIQDLANNPYGITYGAKKGGATLGFFKESDNLLYQRIFEYIDAHPEYQTKTNDEGLERVKSDEENYAFLMESTSIEYVVERHCDVAQVGSLLDNKGYGIAMKKNSPYRQPMSESILQLQEEGKLTRMKDKWWKEKRGGGACADDDAGSGDAQPLVLANVGGVFIVLVAGSGMAFICAFLEMVFDVWLISRKEKVPFKEELIAELKFILSFSGDTKTVRHREPSGSGSGGSKGSKKSKKEEEDNNNEADVESHMEVPTPAIPQSEKSQSVHTSHSRRPSNAMTGGSRRPSNALSGSRRHSNAVQMAKMRKYSGRL